MLLRKEWSSEKTVKKTTKVNNLGSLEINLGQHADVREILC